MPTYQIASDTLTKGRITKKVWADTYPDALHIMDNIVDELDGLFDKVIDPPLTLTFDELESDQFGEYANYVERFGRWQYLLASGWFYTGDIGSEIGRRCGVLARLDPVMFNY